MSDDRLSTVKLSSVLPKEPDQNGLAAAAKSLVADPQRIRIAMIMIDVKEVREIIDDDVWQVVARIRRIEVITEERDLTEARGLFIRAYERRTGGGRLPLVDDLLNPFTTEAYPEADVGEADG